MNGRRIAITHAQSMARAFSPFAFAAKSPGTLLDARNKGAPLARIERLHTIRRAARRSETAWNQAAPPAHTAMI